MQTIEISGQKREELGKVGSKSTRSQGLIPCVLYGGKEVTHFSTTLANVRHLVYSPDFKIADLTIDGKHTKAILKEWQMHPVTEEVVHIDFLQLVEGHQVIVEIPLRFKGESPGVKLGGKLIALVRKLKVKTKPENLIDCLYVDISNMELGQSIRVRDTEIPEGIEILNAGSIPVARIEIPRALRSAAAADKTGK